MSGLHHFGESEEMYLKTIAEMGGDHELVPITGVAERLGITTVSASEMVHRMQSHGMVEHTPYKGVQLTTAGRQRANIVIRRHRLWERFLTDELQLPWDRAHEYACRLEHASDEEVTEALAQRLGDPATCPHGNPIPSPEGEMPELRGEPLSTFQIGQAGMVVRIQNVNELLLAHVQDRGIRPGEPILIEEIAPFNGPLSVRVGGETQVLGREVASHIMVEAGE
jgi:DtxR family Mn-dependent transcriptional regulator